MRCTNKVSVSTNLFVFGRLFLLCGLASVGLSQAIAQSDTTMMLCHPAERVERYDQGHLQTGGFTIKAEGSQFVSIHHEEGSLVLSTPQPDYGGIRRIVKTRSGKLLVIGGQRSYSIELAVDKGHISGVSKQVPLLYQAPCGTIAYIFGNCIEETGEYSEYLSALFLPGYTKEGEFFSLLIGYKEDVVDLTNTDYPFYLADNQKGGAILRGKAGLALFFEGEASPTPCVLR